MTTNFIADGTSLLAAKTDLRPLGASPQSKFIDATSWNEHRTSLLDIQSFLRGNVQIFKASDTTKKFQIIAVTAAPNGVTTALKGSLAVDVSASPPKLYQNTDGATAWVGVGGSTLADSEWYGDGTDGAHHFDGSTTIMGVAPGTFDGVTQVYQFVTDANFAGGTIVDSGVTLRFENCRPFCNGSITNNGHIHNDGRSASGRPGTSPNQSRVYGSSNGGGGSGSNGPGTGGGGSGSGTVIDSWSNQSAAASGANGAGNGQGGGGGTGGSDAGGTGGAIVVAGAADRLNILTRFLAKSLNGSTVYTPGSGGGGGGSTGGGSGTGGGGGAGGCWLFCGFKQILGTGTITCKGGAGGAPTLVDATGCGGGGGGGGGVLTVVYGSNPGPNTFSAAGGAGHAGVGTGAAGGTGSTGSVFALNLSGDGT